MAIAPTIMAPTLDPPLVALSVVLAIGAGYTALEMSGRVSAGRGWARSVWLAGGAAAMGVGIWSTHYVGIMASRLPIAVWYDWRIVIGSLIAAIIAATAAIAALSEKPLRPWLLIGGSVVAGCGAAASHAAGVAAMRLAAAVVVDSVMALTSVLLAVTIVLCALWLWSVMSTETIRQQAQRKVVCAGLLGSALLCVHYVGVRAVQYSRSITAPDLTHAVKGSVLGAMAVSIVTLFVFGLAVLTSIYDYRLSIQRAELRSVERRYRRLFQRSPAGLVRVAFEGRILDCNVAAARMLGFNAPQDLIGESMAPRHFDGTERDRLMDRLRAERTITDLELLLRRQDGSPVWLLMTLAMIEEEDSSPSAYDGMMIDVTDNKHLELELLHAQKLEAVGGLAAGIAHEINTPIQFVSDNTRFLEDSFRNLAPLIEAYERLAAASPAPGDQQVVEQLDAARTAADWEYLRDEAPKALAQMQEGLGRVASIVGAMRDFSRVDSGVEMAAADLNKALESTLIVARNEFKYVAQATTNFAPLPRVMCHLGDLNQVFLNLLINAARAIEAVVGSTNTLGQIDIRTRQSGEWVQIDVSDTGCGIAPEIRNKIFDPFFTTGDVGRGTGQGLTLARTIVVDRHGGTLTFDTEVGKGTTFHIRLPINAPVASAAPRAA